MVLVKMLMDIALPKMGELLLMMMKMISPGRIALPEGKSVPAQVSPRDGGDSSRKLAYDFFSDERLHIAEDGHQRANRGPTRQGARPGGRARPPTLMDGGLPPSGTSFAQYFLYILKIIPVEF